MRKKKYLKIISIIIVAILLIACMTIASQAAGASADDEATFMDGALSVAGSVIDGIVGLLLTPLKLFIIILGTVIRAIAGGIALIGGTSLSGTLDTIMLSPEDILFNKINLTSVDVFDFSVTGPMLTIRQNIAMWYYALRNLAVVILLIILVYVGIRMALSTVAEEEAKYKKMLKDWLVSFILVFLLHYIIIFTIGTSNGLVDIFSKSLATTSKFGNAINDTLANSLKISLSVGLGSAVVYLLLCVLTLIFLIMYIKRMITVSFLILIAPIITITYSIDKMGDGKSQAVNMWLKEFVYNVLIQPFHCVIYLVFGSTAVSLMNGSLASSVLAIIMIIFILQAEKIIKQIFGFKASSLGEGLASAAALGAGMQAVSKGISSGGARAAGAVGGSQGGARAAGAVGGGKTANINKTAAAYGAAGSGSSGGPTPYTPPIPSGSKASQVGGILASKGKNIGKSALNALKPSKAIPAQFKMAARMTGAAFGAVTGNASTAIGMGAIGASLGGKATSAVSNASTQRRVRKNEEFFANAYADYAKSTGLDEDELKDKTQAILDMDPKDIADQDKAYSNFVYAMRDTYNDVGENDPRAKVLDTIHQIHSGNIQPKQPKK